jgi:hypothetical protein
MKAKQTPEVQQDTDASWALRQTNDGAADPNTVLCNDHKDLRAAAMANAGPNTDIHEWMRIPKSRYGCIICIYDKTGESPKAKPVGNPWDRKPEPQQPPASSEFWTMSDEDTIEVREWLVNFYTARGKTVPESSKLARLAWQIGLKIEDDINGIQQYKYGSSAPSQYGGGAGGSQYKPNGYGGYTSGGSYSGYGGYTPYVPPKKKDARDDAFAAFKGTDEADAEITFDTPEDVEDEVVSETPMETILADHAAGEHDTADPECPLCNGISPETGEVA